MRSLPSLALGLALAALPAGGPFAADFGFGADPIYDSPLFNFEGFYVGVQGGGAWFADPGPGVVGTAGLVAGANFAITDAILAGAEFQASGFFNGTGHVGYDALLLGHVGGFIADSVVVYGAAGGGIVDGSAGYALGGGVEAAVLDQVSVRGEVLGLGTWGAMPDGAKGTLGLIWHMN